MVNKVFLDTDIIIDLLLQRKYELVAIEEIFNLGENGKIDLYISESVITNTSYIAQKHKVDTLSFIREICKAGNVISFSKDILHYPIENYKYTEDGILYFLSLKAKMDYFIIRNVKDFIFLSPSLPVITPSHFLKEIYSNDLP